MSIPDDFHSFLLLFHTVTAGLGRARTDIPHPGGSMQMRVVLPTIKHFHELYTGYAPTAVTRIS
jgi:hypothetical protein